MLLLPIIYSVFALQLALPWSLLIWKSFGLFCFMVFMAEGFVPNKSIFIHLTEDRISLSYYLFLLEQMNFMLGKDSFVFF